MLNHSHKKEEKKEAQDHGLPPSEKAEKVVTLKEEDYLKLQDEVLKAQDAQDKLVRMQADFDNARKRMEKQNQDYARYASEGIIFELLTILDDLERTTQAAEDKFADLKTFLKGVEMILAHLYEMLKVHGVKPIEVEGKPFDPHTSEALMQVASDLPEHTVVEELQKGYYLHDRVIRTAKVKVATGKAVEQKSKEIIEDKKV